MYKSIEARLYPTKEQLILFLKNCGCVRFVYNYFLALRIAEYKATGKSIPRSELSAKLTDLKWDAKTKWLQEVDSQSLQQALINLDFAYQNFFRRVRNGEKPGFPKFKQKGHRDSFRLTQSLKVEGNYLKLSKHGWIKFKGNKEPLNDVSKIRNITVSLKAGQWFASCLIEVPDHIDYIHQYESCGIDLGVKKPLTVVYENNSGTVKTKILGRKFQADLQKKETRRKRHQKSLARKQLGSNNRNKAKFKVQRAFQKEANLRRDWIEKTSLKLAENFETIVFEDLNLRQMTKKGSGKSKLNDGMRRLGLAKLVKRTEQKQLERQGEVVYINPKYTSQTCNCCGTISKHNRKSQAKFVCVDCGHKDNADRNAALNIRDIGLAYLKSLQ